jgi:cytochrome c oxidase subunit 3
MLNKQNGEILFLRVIYMMTGLHGLHIVIGIVILEIILVMVIKDKITPTNFVKLENSGLYWHLVDLIWIFLIPTILFNTIGFVWITKNIITNMNISI